MLLLARFVPRLLLAICLLSMWLPSSALADEMIVDNSDPSVQVNGAWATTSSGDGYIGSNYLSVPPNSPGASVFWPVPLGLEPGH